MTLRLRWLALLLCVTGVPLSAGERKPLSQEQQEKLAGLIKKLGDQQFDVREAAKKEILAFGRRARATLEKFQNDDDVEIVLRVGRIIAELNVKSEPVDLGLKWLAYMQEPDGHWDSVKHGSKKNADIENTALALMAFLGAGHTEKVGEFGDNVRRAVAWLRARQRADGAIVAAGERDVDGVAHALAALALAEAAGMANNRGTKIGAQKATDYTTGVHQGETGFARQAGSATPDMFTTALFVMHLKSAKVAGLNVRPEAFDKAIRFLDLADDGKCAFKETAGGDSSTRSTIMGTLSRQFLGWKKEDLQPYAEAIAKDFTPNVEGPKADMLSNYIGTMVMFQQGGKLWGNWNDKLRPGLFDAQCGEEETHGSWNPAGEWLGGSRVAATALCTLSLEVYYRYLQLQR